MKFQDLDERLKKVEWKLKTSKPADEHDAGYRNRRNIYLEKLKNGEIKEPKESTKQHYNVKYDETEKKYILRENNIKQFISIWNKK